MAYFLLLLSFLTDSDHVFYLLEYFLSDSSNLDNLFNILEVSVLIPEIDNPLGNFRPDSG
jgi:hypothetical protein